MALSKANNPTHLVHVIGVDTITPFRGSLEDPFLHDGLDVLLALGIVNVDIPFVPFTKSILQSVGTGAHAVFTDRYAFTAIAIGIEVKFVTSVSCELQVSYEEYPNGRLGMGSRA
jgi:hypothetical protein